MESHRRLLAEVALFGTEAEWRARAIDHLRSKPAHTEALIQVLLYEGETGQAWEVASRHGCSQSLWMTLATTREDTHPLDAIPIYTRQIADKIATKKNHGYQAAVDLMSRVRRLAHSADRPELFDDLLQRVRTEHKAKRNLMALIGPKGW